jgi:hypothetical protein
MFGEEEIITKVTEYETGWSILTDQSSGFRLDKKYGVEPKIGQTVVVECVQGSLIRGITLDGQRVFYKTDEDLEADRQEMLRKMRIDKEARLPDSIKKYEALSEPWKGRVDAFRERGGHEWDLNYLGYEAFCCQEAAKIAERFDTVEDIKTFWDAPYKKQQEMFPGISNEHSGNSFGASCHLAQTFKTKPAYLAVDHGALHGLVGCEEYHCFASLPEDVKQAELERLDIDLGI